MLKRKKKYDITVSRTMYLRRYNGFTCPLCFILKHSVYNVVPNTIMSDCGAVDNRN